MRLCEMLVRRGSSELFAIISFACVCVTSAQLTQSPPFQFQAANVPMPPSQTLTAITYGNGIFLATGVNGFTATSTDGINWTLHSDATNSALSLVATGLTFGNSRFAAIGHSGTNEAVQLSLDGVTWNQLHMLPATSLNAVAYGNGEYVAVGEVVNSGFIGSSTDGVNWNITNLTNYGALFAVVYANGRFVVTGTAGAIVTSIDGLNWTPQLVDAARSNNIIAVVYGNGKFVAHGEQLTVPWIDLTSADGTNWIVYPIGTSYGTVLFGDGFFVALTGLGILASTDALQWGYTLFSRANININNVCYGNGRFVAVVAPSGLLYSNDLSTFFFLKDAWDPLLGFHLSVFGGPIDRDCLVQATTNVFDMNWIELKSYTNNTGNLEFFDSEATNYVQRFYRVVSP